MAVGLGSSKQLLKYSLIFRFAYPEPVSPERSSACVGRTRYMGYRASDAEFILDSKWLSRSSYAGTSAIGRVLQTWLICPDSNMHQSFPKGREPIDVVTALSMAVRTSGPVEGGRLFLELINSTCSMYTASREDYTWLCVPVHVKIQIGVYRTNRSRFLSFAHINSM